MRSIWVLGADESIRRQIELHTKRIFAEGPPLVRQFDMVEAIPLEELKHSGVVVLVDAFHPAFAGFEGVRFLRQHQFQGKIFLFGEPAPESVVEPMLLLGLTGYFSSFDRADLAFVCGYIHSLMTYDGTLDFKPFFQVGGRHSAEQITSFKDFNTFGMKLATFVGRFGLDLGQLKKLLMGLSLGHIKAGTESPSIDHPFTIHYGVDARKLLLAAPFHTRGMQQAGLLKEVTEVLKGLQNTKALPGSAIPELFHVARASGNFILLGGDCSKLAPPIDPMVMIVALSFPKIDDRTQAPFAGFSLGIASEPVDTRSEIAPQQPVPEQQVTAPSVSEISSDAVDAKEQSSTPSQTDHPDGEAFDPLGTIADQDVAALLDEPKVVGDQPVFADSENPVPDDPLAKKEQKLKVVSSDGADAAANAAGVALALAEREELNRLRDLSNTLAADVKRLMKERRQPTTDRELRDAVHLLEDKVKKLLQEKMGLQEQIAERDRLNETLKVQVETLKKTAA